MITARQNTKDEAAKTLSEVAKSLSMGVDCFQSIELGRGQGPVPLARNRMSAMAPMLAPNATPED